MFLSNTRLVVKTGSAKTKTKTKTANGSMKQNAHSSRKNYFYQKLQRHWLMSSLQRKVDLDKKLKYLEIIVEHFFIIIILSILIYKKK